MCCGRTVPSDPVYSHGHMTDAMCGSCIVAKACATLPYPSPRLALGKPCFSVYATSLVWRASAGVTPCASSLRLRASAGVTPCASSLRLRASVDVSPSRLPSLVALT